MIKQALASGNIIHLNKLFDTFLVLKDEKESLRVSIKLIRNSEKINNKERIIQIMDTIYHIMNKQRNIFREILEMEQIETMNLSNRKGKYLKEYKNYLSSSISEMFKKIIKNLKKGVNNASELHKEIELFLQLNVADYSRYLCEVTLNRDLKQGFIEDAESAYKNFFTLADEANIPLVNNCYMTGCYNYGLFQFEIVNKKESAIKYLKYTYDKIVENLDLAFKYYVDSYPIINLISDTFTHWIFLGKESSNKDKEEKEIKLIIV